MSAKVDTLSLYVIYDHPSDFPDMFVIRRWELETPKEVVGLARTADEAREMLREQGLTSLGRRREDLPQVLEVWV